jgi:hypothetical protein
MDRPAWLIGALVAAEACRASWRYATSYISYLSVNNNRKIKVVDAYGLDGVAIVNEEIEISGSRRKPKS